MANVKLNFNDGTNDYDLIHVQSETGSNLTSNKDTIIEGNRADGAILIPAGKKGQRIIVRGILVGEDYEELTDLILEMKEKITSEVATLTLKHYENGGWETDWTYTVRRLGEINFLDSLRISSQEYEVTFLVIAY